MFNVKTDKQIEVTDTGQIITDEIFSCLSLWDLDKMQCTTLDEVTSHLRGQSHKYVHTKDNLVM